MAVATLLEAQARVGEQRGAVWAQPIFAALGLRVIVAAVHADHHRDGPLFAREAPGRSVAAHATLTVPDRRRLIPDDGVRATLPPAASGVQ